MHPNRFSKLLAFVLTRILPIFRDSSSLLQDAGLIAQLSSHAAATEYVNKNNNGNFNQSLSLLKANRDIEDETVWLSHINNYLASMNACQLELHDSNKSKFFHLECKPKKNTNSEPLVSIIMTSFNSEETISYAVESILNQTWKNLELLIIDDLSTDNSWQIVNELANKDQRIKPFRNSHNIGTYASKNIALKFATGKYFTCHDSDDWSHPERIEKQVFRMTDDNAKASIILKIRVLETMEITRFKRVSHSCIDGITHFSLPSMMFESTFFKAKLGSWDCVRFSADKEIYERTQIALKGNLKKYHIFGQICLEADQSLTNHPIYGLKNSKKSTSPRKLYRKAYREWHKSLTSNTTYLSFPSNPRLFKAPDIALANLDDINEALKEHQTYIKN